MPTVSDAASSWEWEAPLLIPDQVVSGE
jgi:hypothetical protein